MEAVTLQLPADNAGLGNELFSNLTFFSRFRQHPCLSTLDIRHISICDAHAAATSARAGFINIRNNKAISLITLNDLPWETEFFKVRMGRMSFFHSPEVSTDLLASQALEAITQANRAHGLLHISADVDIDDYKSLNCLLRLGFEIMDLKRTYVTNTISNNNIFSKKTGSVRAYMPQDHAQINRIIDSARFETRFSRDPYLSPSLTKDLYQKWFDKLIASAGKESNVLVYLRNGEIAGCGGIGEASLSPYGINTRMRTGSMYACTASGIGGYGPVIYQMTVDALQSHGLIEASISLNNTSAIRVVEGIRPNRSVTAYCLRKYCG